MLLFKSEDRIDFRAARCLSVGLAPAVADDDIAIARPTLWQEALLVQKNERVVLAIKIVKYRALARQAPDIETTQRINELIAELEQKLREIDE
jgi:hypothetical protein